MSVHVIFGAMGAGKSTKLIEIAAKKNGSAVVIKPSIG